MLSLHDKYVNITALIVKENMDVYLIIQCCLGNNT